MAGAFFYTVANAYAHEDSPVESGLDLSPVGESAGFVAFWFCCDALGATARPRRTRRCRRQQSISQARLRVAGGAWGIGASVLEDGIGNGGALSPRQTADLYEDIGEMK